MRHLVKTGLIWAVLACGFVASSTAEAAPLNARHGKHGKHHAKGKRGHKAHHGRHAGHH